MRRPAQPAGILLHVTERQSAGDLETLLAHGDTARVVGDLGAGRQWFEMAYGEAEQAGDLFAMAETVLGLSGLWVHEQRAAAGSVLLARLRRMVALIDMNSSTGLRLWVRLAGEIDYRNGGCATVMAALEDARWAEDPPARALALHLAHHCLLGPDHGEVRRSLADELIGESAVTGQRVDLLLGLLWLTVDLLCAADRHATRPLAELKHALAEGGHLAIAYVVSAIDAMLTIRSGRLDEAEEAAQRSLRLGVMAGDVRARTWHTAHLVAIRWYQGRLAELVPTLTKLASSPTLRDVDDSCLAALAAAAATAGDLRTAAGAIATLRGRDLGELPRSSTWLVTMNAIVEAAYLLDDPDTSARVYELLKPYAHLPMVASLGVVCFGSTHQALGVAALTMGQLDVAVQHLRAAVRDNLALGHHPALISSRVRLAKALTRRDDPGDAVDALRTVDTATQESSALGLAIPLHVAHSAAVSCTRDGQRWRVAYGNRSVLVPHSVGMLHLAVLVANPGHEIPCVDLATAMTKAPALAGMSTQPVLDGEAVRAYRHRLAQLDQNVDDPEREWLLAQLAAASGLAGRIRAFPNTSERARLAVTRAIRRSIALVVRRDAHIGEHLQRSVRTGGLCSYRPS